jgi:hypothetical protein
MFNITKNSTWLKVVMEIFFLGAFKTIRCIVTHIFSVHVCFIYIGNPSAFLYIEHIDVLKVL